MTHYICRLIEFNVHAILECPLATEIWEFSEFSHGSRQEVQNFGILRNMLEVPATGEEKKIETEKLKNRLTRSNFLQYLAS